MHRAAKLFFASLVFLPAPLRAAEPPPIETFFKLPQYSAMRFSPDGKWIAALAPVNQAQNLVVLDMAAKKATPVRMIDNHDVVWFDWLSSNRLIRGTGSRGTR